MIPKPIDPSATTTAVWSGDEAIDRSQSPKQTPEQIRTYLANPGMWKERFKLVNGKQPTIFQIGHIPAGRMNELEDLYGSTERGVPMKRLYWACFIEGLTDIKNVPVGEVPKISRYGRDYVDPEWLEQVFAGRSEGNVSLRHCAQEIGMYAYTWNNPMGVDVKNS